MSVGDWETESDTVRLELGVVDNDGDCDTEPVGVAEIDREPDTVDV